MILMRNNGLLKLSVFFVLTLSVCLARAGGNLLQLEPTASPPHHSVIWRNAPLPITWYLSSDGYPGSEISINDLETAL